MTGKMVRTFGWFPSWPKIGANFFSLYLVTVKISFDLWFDYPLMSQIGRREFWYFVYSNNFDNIEVWGIHAFAAFFFTHSLFFCACWFLSILTSNTANQLSIAGRHLPAHSQPYSLEESFVFSMSWVRA